MFFFPLVRFSDLCAHRLECRFCGTPIASEEDGIQVKDRPVRATYENPLGITCEIITVSDAHNILAADSATEEHSWFEGYAWRPIGCAECKSHLGWRFEAAEPYFEPSSFFGLLVPLLNEISEE